MKIPEKGKNLRLVEEQEGAFNDLPLVEGQSIAFIDRFIIARNAL